MSALAATTEHEDEVVGRARTGDRTAFVELLRRYDEGLRALVYRLLRDRERMDDVLQNVYVDAFRGLPRFRGDAGFGSWLYRIAYNASLDELRRSRRVVELPLETARHVAYAVDPAGAVADRSRLAAALAALPVRDRAAVLLVDAQGFDYEEAAEILAVPPGTVASRLHRARAVLRRVLADQEGASDR
jgi:RNA polymerase sigma-70 factor, ECF subfamily